MKENIEEQIKSAILSEIDIVKPISSKRDENSLYSLTKKFIKMITEISDYTININVASRRLGVSRRRIYDVTNILEAVGFVTKWSKNSVKWTGNDFIFEDPSLNDDKEMGDTLDKKISDLTEELKQLSSDKNMVDNAYVTYTDIKNIDLFKNQLLFTVKAPVETTIEYPKFHKGSYTMSVSTDKGKITVLYITE